MWFGEPHPFPETPAGLSDVETVRLKKMNDQVNCFVRSIPRLCQTTQEAVTAYRPSFFAL
jgi:hypothetical protein